MFLAITTSIAAIIVFSQSVFFKAHSHVTIQEESILNNNYSIEEQPFYEDLLESLYKIENNYSLTQLRGESPKETLLNFYAAMKTIDTKRLELKNEATSSPGIFWSEKQKIQKANIEQLFEESKLTLDSSTFPSSISDYFTSLRAIQLKSILDSALSQNPDLFSIPTVSSLEKVNSSSSWRIPNTSITLSRIKTDDNDNYSFVFSKKTVDRNTNIAKTHSLAKIKKRIPTQDATNTLKHRSQTHFQ